MTWLEDMDEMNENGFQNPCLQQLDQSTPLPHSFYLRKQQSFVSKWVTFFFVQFP